MISPTSPHFLKQSAGAYMRWWRICVRRLDSPLPLPL
jgi:hypothetical protein